MKQTIRLTESKFRSIIQEAVKGALNELDPHTYISAAKKARIRGQFDRAKKQKRSNRSLFVLRILFQK